MRIWGLGLGEGFTATPSIIVENALLGHGMKATITIDLCAQKETNPLT